MSHPVDVYVGQRLRLRRTMLGLSQEAIGNAIGVTFQQIQKYERGINRMGASRLYEFARVIGVPVGYFFEGFSPDEPADASKYSIPGMAEDSTPKYEHEKLSSRETLEMMRAYYRITDAHVRKRVSELIKSIADDQQQ